jgi:hypothetical protein
MTYPTIIYDINTLRDIKDDIIKSFNRDFDLYGIAILKDYRDDDIILFYKMLNFLKIHYYNFHIVILGFKYDEIEEKTIIDNLKIIIDKYDIYDKIDYNNQDIDRLCLFIASFCRSLCNEERCIIDDYFYIEKLYFKYIEALEPL